MSRPEIGLPDDLTAGQYEVAERIVCLAGRSSGPAQPQHHRPTRGDYTTTAAALGWLDRNRMIAADGNGAGAGESTARGALDTQRYTR